MSVSVTNTDAGISGKTLQLLEADQTVTGLHSFARGANPPFAVNSGGSKVANLNADQVDGYDLPSADGTTGQVLTTDGAGTLSWEDPSSTVDISGTPVGEQVTIWDDADTIKGTAHLTISADGYINADAQPRCVAYHNTTQNVTSGSTTDLNLNSEDYDVGGMHDTSTNNNRITVPSNAGGVYLVLGKSLITNNNNGTAALHLRVNGSNVRSVSRETAASNFEDGSFEVSAILPLSAGDYIGLAGQATGTTFTFGSSTASYATRLEVVKLW